MDADPVKTYYNQPAVVADYVRAANAVGLWRSEEKVFTRLFGKEDTLLELGCGAGRIAFGLWELGYRRLLGVDVAREMVAEGRRINQVLEYGVSFRAADATKLPFGDGDFDGAIFGFNGLMHLTPRTQRRAALRDIRRVVRPGGWFAFTTHDRASEKYHAYWHEQAELWAAGRAPAGLHEFGDRLLDTPHGPLFIHIPVAGEILEDLAATGWRHDTHLHRSHLAREDERVREFTDDCIFWVAQKPTDELDPKETRAAKA